uniref:RecF/RecN/SMC N-terminal domain-containing protein n=1 Tax=Timema cristinae TaxID=61476 RepID=A0A7R9CE21_TIMCR|nr:unnamed protein product [Timema cristinae]
MENVTCSCNVVEDHLQSKDSPPSSLSLVTQYFYLNDKQNKHVASMVIEGFKSYGKRVEINGFDREFNAITGLNGSGKSNILDAICFVLGISNLTHAFKNNEGNVWTGELEETSLYNLWKDIHISLQDSELDKLNPDDNPTTINLPNTQAKSSNTPREHTASSSPFPSRHNHLDVTTVPSTSKLPAFQDNYTLATLSTSGEVQARAPLPTIPSPFKRVLFWPEDKETPSSKKKREKVPSAVSSSQWQDYNSKKSEEKNRKKKREEK